MNLLLICHTQGYGGVERQILLLCRGLLRCGDRVIVAAPRESWLAGHCKQEGIDCEHLPLRGLGDPRSHVALHRLVRRHAIDVIHGHTRRSAFYGAIAARLSRTPSLASVHSLHTWKQFDLNDRIIAISEAVKRFLVAKSIAPDKIVVVHNGVPAPPPDCLGRREEIRSSIGLAPEELAIGMSARMVPHKGHNLLIDALALLRERHPEARVCFLGRCEGAWYEGLVRQVAERGLHSRVRFLGYRDDVLETLSAMDLYAMPSTTEALSIAVLEAFSIGLPVVASRVEGIPEVVQHEQNGLLCNPVDPADLALQLERLLGDPALRATLGARARETHLARFRDQTMVDATRRVYRSLIEAHR